MKKKLNFFLLWLHYPMKYRAIEKKDFKLIIKAETDVYPTETPLTEDILSDWYLNSEKIKEFGMIYEDENQNIIGFALILPYKLSSFQKVCNGKLTELDSKSEDFISKKSILSDPYVGLHVYHIHKYQKVNDFWKIVFQGLGKIQEKFKLFVFGVSSLAVSYSGINLFGNILNFYENTSFINEQHLMEKDGTLLLKDFSNFEKIAEMMKEGWKYKTRCKFLVCYSYQISPIWYFLNQSHSSKL